MKKRYRNVAFLAELLINILVFSISCAVLVGLFGKAGQLARQTREQGFAGAEMQALVETVKARGQAGLAHAQPLDDGRLACHYDENWQPVATGAQAAYTIYLSIAPEDTGAGILSHLSAVAQNAAGQEIARVDTASYEPRTEGGVP